MYTVIPTQEESPLCLLRHKGDSSLQWAMPRFTNGMTVYLSKESLPLFPLKIVGKISQRTGSSLLFACGCVGGSALFGDNALGDDIG
jgi:hypothetical protein